MTNGFRTFRMSVILMLPCLLAGCTGGSVLEPGSQMPTLEAVGWVNGDEPTTSQLAGKVVVIDVWAFW